MSRFHDGATGDLLSGAQGSNTGIEALAEDAVVLIARIGMNAPLKFSTLVFTSASLQAKEKIHENIDCRRFHPRRHPRQI